jgi:hypothetical protein
MVSTAFILTGILMTFAWIATAPTGIVLARYFKVVWPTGKWFHVSLFETFVS